jgi:ribosome-associated toxin RatA of RatAB toxin-antitoxin module
MKRTYHAFALLLSIFIISKPAWAQSIKLESVPNSKQKQGTIHHVFKARWDEVWDVIMDIEHYSEFMPKNKKTDILESDKSHVRYRAKVAMPWPISDIGYDCDVFPMKDLQRIEFEMVPNSGKGVKNFYGHWVFKKISDQEIDATYMLMFEPSRNYPQWAMNIGLKSTLGQVMKNVQDRINKQRQVTQQ